MTSKSQLLLSGKRQVHPNGNSEWAAIQSIQLFGVRVGIQTNQPELLERLPQYFPPLWKPVAITTVDRVYSLQIGKRRHTIYEDNEDGVEISSIRLFLDEFERRLKMYVAEMARRRVFVHSGAVGWKGKAILIPGRSYSGKTTLVRELVRAGATYYSDEYAVLDMKGQLHPYPQPLAIRKNGSLVQQKHPVETLGGVVGDKPLPVGLVIVGRYRENARWRPVQLSAGQGILALLDNTVPARRKPAVVLPVLQKAVATATILKGERSEAKEIAHRILEKYA